MDYADVDLDYLRRHWGEAYRFIDAGGVWFAIRKDNDDLLMADTPLALLLKTRDHYMRRKHLTPQS